MGRGAEKGVIFHIIFLPPEMERKTPSQNLNSKNILNFRGEKYIDYMEISLFLFFPLYAIKKPDVSSGNIITLIIYELWYIFFHKYDLETNYNQL